jgi:hypothetical protein
MFTVRNSRTRRKKIEREREKKGKETIILRGNPSQNEGEKPRDNHRNTIINLNAKVTIYF